MYIWAEQCLFIRMSDRHQWWKKTDSVPCEPDVVASVGLDHQNPMRPSTVYLKLFPAAPLVSNLFSEGGGRCSCYCSHAFSPHARNLKQADTKHPKGERIHEYIFPCIMYVVTVHRMERWAYNAEQTASNPER